MTKQDLIDRINALAEEFGDEVVEEQVFDLVISAFGRMAEVQCNLGLEDCIEFLYDDGWWEKELEKLATDRDYMVPKEEES